MENFIVSARKYRPQTFEDVVGQQSITSTLENAIKNNHLAQAFLFCGPRGVGKTTCARILARTINQQATTDMEDEDFSFNIFELDAASNNSVDDIRNLIDQVRFAPQVGKYKVYIIDEVHMLSQQAFNAFLKTLEEPPSYAIFILATTEKHKILPTILSRCQIFDFKRIKVDDMVDHLQRIADKENITADRDALHIVAQKADGALRDALSIFDQLVSFAGKQISYEAVIENLNVLDYDYYFQITDALLRNDPGQMLMIYDDILQKGFEGQQFLAGLSEHFRDLLVTKNPATAKLLEVGDNIREKYVEQAHNVPLDLLMRGLNLLSQADVQYKNSNNQRLLVELCLLQICTSPAIEKKTSDVGGLPPTPAKTAQKKADSQSTVESSTSKPVSKKELSTAPNPTAQAPEKIQKAEPKHEDPASVAPEASYEKPISSPTEKIEEPENKHAQITPGALPQAKRSLSGKLGKMKRQDTMSLAGMKMENKNLEKDDEDTELSLDPVAGKPREPFSLAELKATWQEFSKHLAAEGKQSLTATFDSIPKIKNNEHLVLHLHNDVQLVQINEVKPDLIEFLREKLQNWGITLEAIVEEVEDSPSFLPRDQLKAMEEKNPTLAKMRQEFDLDIDY